MNEVDYTDGKRRLVVRVDHELDRDELIYVLAHHALIHAEVKYGPMPTKGQAEAMVWAELDRRGRTSTLAMREVDANEVAAVTWAEAVVAEHWPKVTR